MRNTFQTLPGYKSLSVNQRRELCEFTILYAFRFVKYRQYMECVKTMCPSLPVSEIQVWVRAHVLENAYLMHNIKHWVYNTVCTESHPLDMAQKCRVKEYDLHMAELFAPGTKLHEHVKTLGTKPRPPKRTERIIDDIVHRNMDYLAKFVYRKLRFISMYWAVDSQDLIHDVACRGIRALRHEWPSYPSREYMENLYRRSAQNEGKNIIDRATSAKNARLIGVPGGFHTVTVSWDQMLENNQAAADVSVTVDWQKHVDLSLDIKLLTGDQEWRKKTVSALSGYDHSLATWLKERGLAEDNEDYLEEIGIDEYGILLAKWLTVPYPLMRKFIVEMRTSLKVWSKEDAFC